MQERCLNRELNGFKGNQTNSGMIRAVVVAKVAEPTIPISEDHGLNPVIL